jgi:DNA sulfur modification protein DndB
MYNNFTSKNWSMFMIIANDFSHSFPAIRGIQAGRAFYIAMCPMKVIPKIFVFNEEEVPPELRAQRTLNNNRIPEIAAYLVNNPKDFILSALTASVDADMNFVPHGEGSASSNMGTLQIPMDAHILINDGQHRRAAIEEALKENPALGLENIPVLFFIDSGLKRSQQMFADLNKYAIRPSTSLSTLYDHRDSSSELARYLMQNVIVFKQLTEKEKSTISNRSSKLFTLSSIKQASKALLRKGLKVAVTEEEKKLAGAYWNAVAEQMSDWQKALRRTVATAELRQNYIHSHGIALHALGVAGAELLAKHPRDWQPKLKQLKKIDWSRSNIALWEGRAMVHGRISKALSNIQLTSNVVKKAYGLRLSAEDQALEKKIAK